MEVILKEDINKLGHRDLRDVRPGAGLEDRLHADRLRADRRDVLRERPRLRLPL